MRARWSLVLTVCGVACGDARVRKPAVAVVAVPPGDVAPRGDAAAPQARDLRLAAGAKHACVLAPSGSVFCWGESYFGQLGDGTLTGRGVAAKVPGLDDAVDISAGFQA